jgi:hypothetical protein
VVQIVTSHTNTDFDALASMVACTCLYPGARGVLPSHVTAGVRGFLAIHPDLLRITPRKGFDKGRSSRMCRWWGRMMMPARRRHA